MKRNRTERRPVVYLDETWANAHDGKNKAWVEKDATCKQGTIGGVKFVEKLNLFLINFIHRKPSGKGERLIVLHAGGKDGWVAGK